MNKKNQDDLEIVSGAYLATTTSGHPTWCDRSRCTAITVATTGIHRSMPMPAHLTALALIGYLTVTASLMQARAAWPIESFIQVEFAGLEHDWMSVRGLVTLTCDGAADLVLLLLDLAGTAEIAQVTEIASYLSGLSIGRRRRIG